MKYLIRWIKFALLLMKIKTIYYSAWKKPDTNMIQSKNGYGEGCGNYFESCSDLMLN